MKRIKRINKNVIWACVSLLLAVLTIRVVLQQSKDISVTDLADMIRSSDLRFFVPGLLAAIMYVWLEGVAICSILKHTGYPSHLNRGLLYSTSDVYFSAITPSATGGQPASAWFMIRDGIPTGIATAVLVLNLLMYTASIIALGVISILICPEAFGEYGDFSRFLIFIGFAALSLLALAFFVLLKNEKLIFNPASKLLAFLNQKKIIKDHSRFQTKLDNIRNEYKICSHLISGKKRILFGAFFWNFLQRASQIMVPMLIYRSLGGEEGKMIRVFVKQCLITIGYNFIPIPGGMGVSDYLMIDGFSRMMSEEMAYSVEMISRGMTFYICVSLSGIITLIWYFVGRRKNDRCI